MGAIELLGFDSSSQGAKIAPLSTQCGMDLNNLKPWERDAIQRLLIVRRELADAQKRIRLACLLASLSDTDEGVLSFTCSQGRVRVTAGGVQLDTHSSGGRRHD